MMSRRILALSCVVVCVGGGRSGPCPSTGGDLRSGHLCSGHMCSRDVCPGDRAPRHLRPENGVRAEDGPLPHDRHGNPRVTVTECRPEVRQRKVTVCQQVPETKAVQRTCTIMVPETRKRTEKYTVCKPVMREETREYTVMVPHTETRQGTRQVCKMVPVKEKRIVCEDQGHWEQRACKIACARLRLRTCCPVRTFCCWVPKIVQKEVEVTCCKPQMVTEPCSYKVTVCKPEKRTCKVQVCDYKQEEATREVCYTVCVPKTITRTEQVTTCKTRARWRRPATTR